MKNNKKEIAGKESFRNEKNIKNAVGLTYYFISLPPSKYLLILVVLLGLIFGIGINFNKYSGLELLIKGIVDGLILISIPALLSSAVIKLMIRKMPFKRIIATTLIGEVIYAIAYSIGIFLFSISSPFYAELFIIFGAAIVFVIWYVIARLIFILRFRSILFAIIQLLFHLVFLLSSNSIVNTELAYSSQNQDPIFSAVKFYLASFILMIAIYIFFIILSAPTKKNFGLSSTDVITSVVAQWLYKDKRLENTFERLGHEAKTLVSLLTFKRKNDSVFFVIPCVHFGPFGTLGGSEFSYLIAKELNKKYVQDKAKTFVFHGTATHDLNPVSTNELSNLIKTCDKCIKKASFENFDDATIVFSQSQKEECFAETLLINDTAFVGLTRAPHVTEDVNFGLGLAMASEAEKYVKLAVIADQHNAETGEITTFEPGDPIAYNYVQAVIDSIKKATTNKKLSKNPLSVGISERHIYSPFIGKAGIKVAVFSSSPDYVLILIDCNGIAPEYREEIMMEIKKIGKHYKKNWNVGVFTTDTHQVNVVRGVRNPLKEEKNVLEEIKTAVVEAMFDMQPTRFHAAKNWFNIRVIGAKQSVEIVSTINAIVSVAKIVGPMMLLASLGAVYLLLSRI